jgi:hypothetical protein
VLAWRSGCAAMNGGFCHLPSAFCVHRHTPPLWPLDQRRQCAGQFCKIALMCYGFARMGAVHDCAFL